MKLLTLLLILLFFISCKSSDCENVEVDTYEYIACKARGSLPADCESFSDQELKNYCWQYYPQAMPGGFRQTY